MPSHPAIVAQDLTKDYHYFEKEEGLRGSIRSLFNRKTQTRRAVSGFSFTLEGGIVGLIGPNGAGKTTLIKLLTGIIRPTQGSARVLGFDPTHPSDAYKKHYALVMGQKSQLWWDLPALDTFLLNQAIYEIPEDTFRRNLARYAGMFGVNSLLKVPVRQLSLGERMKMEIIASLLHDPQVLFLDEPTIGLDATAQRQIRELLHQVNRESGVSVLLTSHYMEDILDLCERVMVIRQGQKIYDGSLKALLDRYKETMVVTVRFSVESDWLPPIDVECLERTPMQLSARMPRGRTRTYLQEVFSNTEAADVRIDEEDVGELVEKVYRLEGNCQA